MSTKSHSFYQRAQLQIKLLSNKATLPKAGSDLAAGLDLASAVDMEIPPRERALVKTDLSIACPPGTYGRIAPRSGLALKKGIDVGGTCCAVARSSSLPHLLMIFLASLFLFVSAGVIDADYRGPVGVILFNWGNDPFQIKVGDRIAQLILEQIVLPDIVQVEELVETERGAAGFGSTGVKTEPTIKKQRTVSPTDGVAATTDPVDEEKADTN